MGWGGGRRKEKEKRKGHRYEKEKEKGKRRRFGTKMEKERGKMFVRILVSQLEGVCGIKTMVERKRSIPFYIVCKLSTCSL